MRVAASSPTNVAHMLSRSTLTRIDGSAAGSAWSKGPVNRSVARFQSTSSRYRGQCDDVSWAAQPVSAGGGRRWVRGCASGREKPRDRESGKDHDGGPGKRIGAAAGDRLQAEGCIDEIDDREREAKAALNREVGSSPDCERSAPCEQVGAAEQPRDEGGPRIPAGDTVKGRHELGNEQKAQPEDDPGHEGHDAHDAKAHGPVLLERLWASGNGSRWQVRAQRRGGRIRACVPFRTRTRPRPRSWRRDGTVQAMRGIPRGPRVGPPR